MPRIRITFTTTYFHIENHGVTLLLSHVLDYFPED